MLRHDPAETAGRKLVSKRVRKKRKRRNLQSFFEIISLDCRRRFIKFVVFWSWSNPLKNILILIEVYT